MYFQYFFSLAKGKNLTSLLGHRKMKLRPNMSHKVIVQRSVSDLIDNVFTHIHKYNCVPYGPSQNEHYAKHVPIFF
jgi:hypothetical protein